MPWVMTADQPDVDAEITASVPVLVDFWAAWWPCRVISPVVERLAGRWAGRTKPVKVNLDDTLSRRTAPPAGASRCSCCSSADGRSTAASGVAGAGPGGSARTPDYLPDNSEEAVREHGPRQRPDPAAPGPTFEDRMPTNSRSRPPAAR
jgi:hypothetical protein